MKTSGSIVLEVRLYDWKLLTGTELAIKQRAHMRFLGRKMLNFNCVWTTPWHMQSRPLLNN